MTINIKNIYNRIIPQIENEEISLDSKTSLEKIFFKIFNLIERFSNAVFERRKGSNFFHFFRDLIFISLILETLTQIFFIIPLLLTPDDPSKNVFSMQIIILTLFCSISWTGFIYLTDEFRNLARDKVIPVIVKRGYPLNSGFYTFIRQFFNGTLFKWPSGKVFRIHLRTFIFLLIALPIFIGVLKLYTESLLQNPSTTNTLMFIIFLFTLALMAFFLFIISYIIFTIMAIFFYLFMIASSFNIEIISCLDMGGLQKFGEIIIHSIYLVSFGLASVPIFFLVSKMRSMPTISIDQFANQSIMNISGRIRDGFVKTANETTLNSFSQYYSIFFLFSLFVVAALILIVLFHYRIKQKKGEELEKIEIIIQNTKYLEIEEQTAFEKNQYLYSLHEQILNSYEWPIKRVFVIELLLAGIPLVISHIL